MKKLLFIISFLILTISSIAYCNSAQPGIFNAGGNGGFTLLFEEDSTFYKKIQMQKERISIQLHKGFAIVKGEYWMLNTTADSIKMKTGYPIDASYETHKNAFSATHIFFDKLYALQVTIDDIKTAYSNVEYSKRIPNIHTQDTAHWYVWDMIFKPNGITKIEVFFVINTNDAHVREGYNSHKPNAFIYVLETGATWKNPIEKGSISIQLMDGMTIKNIGGISFPYPVLYDPKSQILDCQFEHLIPTHDDNFVISYSEHIENFDFENIISKADLFFEAINGLSNRKINSNLNHKVDFDSPFDVPMSLLSYIFVAIFYFFFYGLPLIIGAIILFIVIKLVKKR